MQNLFNHIIKELIRYKHFEIFTQGASDGLMQAIFSYTNAYLCKHHKVSLQYHRSWNKRMEVQELMETLNNHKAVILRIRSNTFDHFTIYSRIDGDKIKFFDSDSLPTIKLSETSPTTNEKKNQIILRQIYFMELSQCSN